MEKFGIFELLDALSALTAQEDIREEKKPSPADSIYQAPVYGNPPQQQQPQQPPKSEPHTESDALAGFYARHDAVAKKAGKK